MRLIESERLYARYLETDDLESYYQLNGDEEIMRYIRPAKNREETELFLKEVMESYKKENIDWRLALLEKDTDIFVGSFAIIPLDNTNDLQLGYSLLKEYWGRGYATEITKAGMQYAFNVLGVSFIYGVTEEDNIASQHVLLKCGFVLEKTAVKDRRKLNLYKVTKLTQTST
jgi:ribosomal-protein-alanine N-acetyltransferase